MMTPLLPERVRAQIREQIASAVTSARRSFEGNYAQEEALSGVLIHELDGLVRGSADGFAWEMRPLMVSKNLADAGEAVTGADILIELQVRTHLGRRIGQKVVAVQVKKDWTGLNRDVLDQARKLNRIHGAGLVANLTGDEYFAWGSGDVVEAEGDRRRLRSGRTLASTLGDFVDCRVGSRNLRIDKTRSELVDDWSGERTRVRAESTRVLLVRRPPIKRPAITDDPDD